MFYKLEGTHAFVAELLHQLCYKAKEAAELVHPGKGVICSTANTSEILATSSGCFSSVIPTTYINSGRKRYFIFLFLCLESQAPPFTLCGIISNQ